MLTAMVKSPWRRTAGRSPVVSNTFHPRAGTTVLDTGANVQPSNFMSIALNNGESATLTLKGAGRLTMTGDFNVSDLSTSRGTLNIQLFATPSSSSCLRELMTTFAPYAA